MELAVKTREILGKKVKSLRRAGLVPAELFGSGVENQHLAVTENDFIKVYRKAGSHTVVYLINEKGGKIPTLISEVQEHPLTGNTLSVNFHQIKMDEMIEARVPVEFTGAAPAEKAGLVVIRVLHEIEIKSLPDKIPHSFKVDLGKLEKMGDSIHVSDLRAPSEVKILAPTETVIATVIEKAREEVAPPPATEMPAAAETEAKAAEPEKTEVAPKEEKKQ